MGECEHHAATSVPLPWGQVVSIWALTEPNRCVRGLGQRDGWPAAGAGRSSSMARFAHQRGARLEFPMRRPPDQPGGRMRVRLRGTSCPIAVAPQTAILCVAMRWP